MAEERAVEVREDELSEAVQELVAEALACEEEPKRESADHEVDFTDPRWLDRDRWIELAREGTLADYFLQDADREEAARRRTELVDRRGEAEDGRPRSERTVDFAAARRGDRQALLDAWERMSG